MTAPLELHTDRDTRAWHDFLRAIKLSWSGPLYRQLHSRFAALESKQPFADVDVAETQLRSEPLYQWFGWLERNLQDIKYNGSRGIVSVIDAQQERLLAALQAAKQASVAEGLLVLDPELEYPDYYRNVEFHQHPGGVWQHALAGFEYEFGRQTTTPLHADAYAVHQRMAAAVPRGDYRRILDWGCAQGASTLPFAKLYPTAELYGIDMAAPCLEVANLRAREQALKVHWSQQNMERTNFPDAHFDLVHSTFLLHELPRAACVNVVREAWRILQPGGYFVNLDFHSPPGGTWGKFIYYGHARRNNEVFMRSFCETNFLELQTAAGFSEARMLPFDDGTGYVAADEIPSCWRFPWQLFVARKPV